MRVKSINNCKEYNWVNGILYTIDNNNNFCIDQKTTLEGNFSIRGSAKGFIWLFDQVNFETYIYSDFNLVHRITDYGLILKYSLNNQKYIVGINSGIKLSKGIYNFESMELEKEFKTLGLNGIYLMVDDDLFITQNKKAIALFKLDNEIKWQQSFAELAKSGRAILHSKILYSNNKLFFVITGNENKALFVLDLKTGEVLEKFIDMNYEIFQDNEYIYTTRFKNILCRINSKDLTVEEWDVSELLKAHGFESIHDHRCSTYLNKFYLTQSIGDTKSKIAVLDWDEKKLIYKYNFDPDNGGIVSIQVIETKIFIHTQDKTLHIFEK